MVQVPSSSGVPGPSWWVTGYSPKRRDHVQVDAPTRPPSCLTKTPQCHFTLRKYTFRMLKHTALLHSVHPGDWFISVDLKDAYFHISIYFPHRTFLRFAFQCVIYTFLVLPFSFSCVTSCLYEVYRGSYSPTRRDEVLEHSQLL
jgi:hypothetical protein